MDWLGNNVKIFKVKGITIIANRNNGMVIGLDREGEEVVDLLKNNRIEISSLSDNQKELYKVLEENDFLKSCYQEVAGVDSVYLHVNSACNLHCLGCYSYGKNRNTRNELSFDEWKCVIDDLSLLGVKNIVISGGEPFLRKDLREICKYIKETVNGNLEVISNGTMNISDYEMVLPYIDALNISIDGYDDKTSFIRDKGIMKRVLDTVERLKEKIPVKLIVTLHKKNVPFMKEYENLAKKLGVFMSFSIFTVDFSEKIFKDYKFSEDDFVVVGDNITESENGTTILDTPTDAIGITYREGCGFGKKTISIAYNGDIYPCHMLHCQECKMGNIKHDRLKEIIDGSNFEGNDILLDDVEECGICEYKNLCGGACRGRAYLFTGDMKKRDPYCLAAKRFYNNLFAQYTSI